MSLHRCLLRSPAWPAPRFTTAAAWVVVAFVGLQGAAAPVQAAGRGDLSAGGSGLRAGEAPWPRWQGRLSLTTASHGDRLSLARPDANLGADTRSLHTLSLLGDYYFTQQGLAPASHYSGGFRASGGLIVGPRRAASASLFAGGLSGLGSGFSAERRSFSLSAPPIALDGSETSTQSVPYLGVGYTGLQSVRGTGGGWGFSADVGVMALQPRSGVRLGQQSVSDTVRELEISPLLQLGVSYSF